MNQRPSLNARTDPATFLEHYWLTEELVAFCRDQGLKSDGPKRLLSIRVAAFLNGEAPPAEAPRRIKRPMPAQFTRDTIIGEGWSCSQALRAFFRRELGPSFHFDRFMREQVHNGAGQTLGQVMTAWAAQTNAKGRTEIGPQFEYNRFVREYRMVATAASHREVVAAWRRHRDTPVSQRRPIAEQVAESKSGQPV